MGWASGNQRWHELGLRPFRAQWRAGYRGRKENERLFLWVWPEPMAKLSRSRASQAIMPQTWVRHSEPWVTFPGERTACRKSHFGCSLHLYAHIIIPLNSKRKKYTIQYVYFFTHLRSELLLLLCAWYIIGAQQKCAKRISELATAKIRETLL